MKKKIAVMSDKGGVAKTTTAVHIAGWAARMHGRTLFIDCDPKADATSAWIGFEAAHGNDPGATLYHVLCEKNVSPEDVIQTVPLRYQRRPSKFTVDLIRSHVSMKAANVALMNMLGRELKLANWLRQVEDRYDYVVMDCLPDSQNLITINALMAADELVIPVEPEPYAMVGMKMLLNMMEQVSEARQAARMVPLKLRGIVPVKFRSNLTMHREALEALNKAYPNMVLTAVPDRTVVPQAAQAQMDLFAYESSNWSDVTRAMSEMAEQVLLEPQTLETAEPI